MSKITYEQAFEDHSYLWEMYGAAYDMTGGYSDQHDLDRMLRKPSKATARDCLHDQIVYWFQVGFGAVGFGSSGMDAIKADYQVEQIAIRHGLIEDGDSQP